MNETLSQPQEKERRYKSSPQEIVLETGGFEKETRLLGGGVGDARWVKIKDDGCGVFKPHSRHEKERASWFVSRERAAYLVSRFLGFDFVPPTVVKKVEDQTGSLQEFVEDATAAYATNARDILDGERSKLMVFDDLILNLDRHGGNYLIKNGRIIAIDNGYSFEQAYTFRLKSSSIYLDYVPASLAEKLKRFASSQEQQEILRDLLKELLDGEIVDAFMERVDAYIKSINLDNTFDRKKFELFLRNLV